MGNGVTRLCQAMAATNHTELGLVNVSAGLMVFATAATFQELPVSIGTPAVTAALKTATAMDIVEQIQETAQALQLTAS